MSVTKQQVLDALAKLLSPRGTPLTQSGALSDIVVNDGKVFFSINVAASEARAWEEVRVQADRTVKALPGVASAMIALTAERAPGGPSSPSSTPQQRRGVAPASAHRHPQHAHGAAPASPMSKQAAIPGVEAIIAVASGKSAVSGPAPRGCILPGQKALATPWANSASVGCGPGARRSIAMASPALRI